MTDKIEVDVEDLRAVTTIATRQSVWLEVAGRLRAALAEYDKAEQERLDALVFVEHEDGWPSGQLRALPDCLRFYVQGYGTPGRYWWQVTPEAVEALGEFYPHQIDHAFDGRASSICVRCTYPEWAHTPPAVPDWQADETVLVVKDGGGELWMRDHVNGEDWATGGSGPRDQWHWSTLAEPVTPVGWRRDPDSITIPKSALDGLSAKWFRSFAEEWYSDNDHPVSVNVFRAIADALEADHA